MCLCNLQNRLSWPEAESTWGPSWLQAELTRDHVERIQFT